jgi:hypothetical protein
LFWQTTVALLWCTILALSLNMLVRFRPLQRCCVRKGQDRLVCLKYRTLELS